MIRKIRQLVRRFRYKKAISVERIDQRFENIYKQKLWFSNRQSRSGAGSTLEATQNLREQLPHILMELKAENLVDIGCGDFYWMKEVNLPCRYIGLDIVTHIIQENQRNYANKKRTFHNYNAIDDSLPLGTDVVLCREVLFHLSLEDGISLINNILNSEARYFMGTTSLKIDHNHDIRTGEFRNINLTLPPFNFPDYEIKIHDSTSVSSDRFLALWDVQKIRTTINY